MPSSAGDSKEGGLENSISLVTGAGSGIGRAIAIALASAGAVVYAIGKDQAKLQETAGAVSDRTRFLTVPADLTRDPSVLELEGLVRSRFGRLDILVHCAGVIQLNLMATARVADLDEQYAADVRAPYFLTQTLLPMLKQSQGQIVFVDSSLGLRAERPDVGQFAATQHAMKAIADSLRQEVNGDRVRVLNLFLGRTATPRQNRLYEQEGREYQPDLLMQPEDVAHILIAALTLPRTGEVTEIRMRPLRKSY